MENRSQLVTVCGLGPQVFLNCAGFIKIDTAAISDTTTNYIEVLDGSRVHPETYEWAKKMAVDALEYDEVTKLACVEVAWQLLGIKAREEGGRRKFPSFLPSLRAYRVLARWLLTRLSMMRQRNQRDSNLKLKKGN